jgi:CRISPR/Cas system-associated exonuclease Cas4 (RecB family)
LNKYQECPRKHYYQYVLGFESPSTDAQDYGKKCHEYLEQYLKGEISEFPKDYQGKTCQAAKEHLPLPNSGEVEKEFQMQLPGLDVPIIGFMDYCAILPEEKKVVLLDHKIVKSDQFLLTPEKLAQTNQIITYSKYLLDQSDASMVEASYLYIKRGGGFVKKVSVDLSRDQVEQTFKEVAQGFQQLQNNFTKETENV